ncbi:L,D-transpeptidase [Methylocystis sp. 9N]|uniref:L,D-transpeptidase n=1 Tax=Methylocystis borbori TaxID=3118750 RepID=A0ABU7XIX4_9HYPH
MSRQTKFDASRFLAVAALAAATGLASTAVQAKERSFFEALFNPQGQNEEMTAYYNDGREQQAYYGAQDQQQAYYGGQDQQGAYGEQEDQKLAREYPSTTREIVADPTNERPGTITVDTKNRYLYLSLPNGEAVRYGVGVGRDGFTWKGRTHVGRKEAWPDWTPPAAMLKRRPDLPRHMAGGEDNPLGARAMYLFSGDRDTMFRIHGSNEPWSIGQAVSSGCIRMLNTDVTDLYSRVKVGTAVNVL